MTVSSLGPVLKRTGLEESDIREWLNELRVKDVTPTTQHCAYDLMNLQELEQILAPMYETSNEDDASETRPQSTEEMKMQQEWNAMLVISLNN